MQSLLKDIRLAATHSHEPHPTRALRDAVVEHLRDLCSTPRRSVLLARDYGIEDPTRLFHEYPGSALDMAQHLHEIIMRYEPRLTATSVTHVKTDEIELLLRFEIAGMLVVNGRPAAVRFSTIIDTDNRVELR